MTKTEYLLICLAEECSELAQAATKALRFGLGNKHTERTTTNETDIMYEFVDVMAVMELLAVSKGFGDIAELPEITRSSLDKSQEDKKSQIEECLNRYTD